mmetsp:Transcript_23074/g.34411  ORF Transcript_23074/g.34411 Transcript_23074/m.34411 type:complete len:220 (-) Transcript_23074:313-972(-)
MNPFLKAYCFRFKAVTAELFKDFFLEYCKGKVDGKITQGIEWEKWLYTPGMPYKANKFDTTLVDASVMAAESTCEGKVCSKKLLSSWSSPQTVVFLDRLEDIEMERLEKAKKDGKLAEEKAKFRDILKALNDECELSKSMNSEIIFRWYKVGIRCDMKEVFPGAVKFMTSQGRMKFVRPLYRLLYASEGKKLALDTFKAHRNIYHSIASKMLAKDLDLA